MRKLIAATLLTTLFTPFLFHGLSAGIFCQHGLNPCARCQPCVQCHQPRPCGCQTPQTHLRPVTQHVPQVSYRDVTTTQYRTEPRTESVPVTTYRTVTEDQGSWQKIWVPKLIQKQVPQTVYQQRTSYHQVPYQVTQRVPQVTYTTRTAMVPFTTTQTRTSWCNTCGPATTAWSSVPTAPITASPLYSPVYPTAPVIGIHPAPPALAVTPHASPDAPTPRTSARQPVQIGRELEPLSRLSDSSSSDLKPVPQPRDPGTSRSARIDDEDDDVWAPIPTRTSKNVIGPIRTSSASGLFVPAPSSARAWRARDVRLR